MGKNSFVLLLHPIEKVRMMLEANQDDKKQVILNTENDRIEEMLQLLLNLKDIHISEARIWFCFSLIAANLGFLIILVGLITWFVGFVPNGWTASVVGTIPTAISVLFFQQKKMSDSLIEEDVKKISKLCENEIYTYRVLNIGDKELVYEYFRKNFDLPH